MTITSLSYNDIKNLPTVGSTSARQFDDRTTNTYYIINGKLVARANNYSLFGTEPQFGGLIINNGRALSHNNVDITDRVLEDLNNFEISTGLRELFEI